jgi:putative transposase
VKTGVGADISYKPIRLELTDLRHCRFSMSGKPIPFALMPRLPRSDVPDVPQHVIQRVNDRKPCFFSDEDYARYLNDLREIAMREHCAAHAYVLITNHVHLPITPSAAGAIGRVMQSLGRRYVRHVNDRYHRTGTLWEGRYKACLVEDDEHLWRCYRYIELNPLRAGMVADPGDYRWSSHRCNAFGEHDPLVTLHRAFRSLSANPVERQRGYRALVVDTVAPIEAQLGLPVGPQKIGRPKKSG